MSKSKNLLPRLKTMVTARAREEIETLFGPQKRGKQRIKRNAKKVKVREAKGARPDRPLRDLFPTGKVLYATYKGKEYKAYLRRNGTMKFRGSLFYNPSAAARAVTGKAFNGWRFWKYKDKAGKLHPISQRR